MRWRLGTVALAAFLIGGCGGPNNTVSFSNEAAATCRVARQSVDARPERASEELKRAAEYLRGLDVPESQRAAAGTLAAGLRRLSRSADALSSQLGDDHPDPARTRRLSARLQDDQERIAATALTLGVTGCDAMTAVLLRDRAVVNARDATPGLPGRLSRAAYRTRLRRGLGNLEQRTSQVQDTLRSGTGSSSTLSNYAAFVGTVVNRLAPLRPPASVASAHRDLVAGLRALRTATTRAARDLRAGRPQQATQVVARFYTSQSYKDLTAATATLTKGGYLPS
jgi:hypothetical protein